MELTKSLTKLSQVIKKYRYAVLVLVIGLILMAIPGTGNREDTETSDAESIYISEQTLESKLSEVLSRVDGAGNVKVLLTVAAGEETVYQTNDDISSSNDASSTNYDTVTVTDANRNQNGLIRQINPATYQGAVIVCQGADDPNVRLAIVDAVSKLTGLGANRISVLKMN